MQNFSSQRCTKTKTPKKLCILFGHKSNLSYWFARNKKGYNLGMKCDHAIKLVFYIRFKNNFIVSSSLSSLSSIPNIKTLQIYLIDFELQALILEIVFRLLPPSERASYISKWFDNKELRQIFTSIQDTAFEPVSDFPAQSYILILARNIEFSLFILIKELTVLFKSAF